MKEYDCSLPEFVIFDAFQHQGNKLNGRTVLEHIPSRTIAEVITLKGRADIDPGDTQTHRFDYRDVNGNIEKVLLAVHSSVSEPDQIKEILVHTAEWLCAYWNWEDETINKGLNSLQPVCNQQP
jgi:hypothetical protein